MKKGKVPQLRFLDFNDPWKTVGIKDLGDVITGSTPSTTNSEFYGGEYFFVSPGDISKYRYVNNSENKVTDLGFKEGRKVKKGSTLFVSIGSTIGKIGQVTKDCITNQQINSIVSNDNYDQDFIFSLLENYSPKIKILSATQAVPIINKTNFESFLVKVPSLEEQQKIANFLSSVDQKIQQLRRKKELLEEYKKGVMQKLFSQEIRFKDENGEDFPDWEYKELGEISDRITDKNEDEEIDFVLTNSAVEGVVSQTEYFDKSIANKSNLGGYYIVKEDDFVYNPRISSEAPVGPIKRNKLKTGVMSPLYSVFRIKEKNIDFFEYFFETTLWHRYMHSVANFGARHDRMNITVSDFQKLPIPLPSEAERKRITDFVNSVSNKLNSVNRKLELAEKFKKGLLQQMFV